MTFVSVHTVWWSVWTLLKKPILFVTMMSGYVRIAIDSVLCRNEFCKGNVSQLNITFASSTHTELTSFSIIMFKSYAKSMINATSDWVLFLIWVVVRLKMMPPPINLGSEFPHWSQRSILSPFHVVAAQDRTSAASRESLWYITIIKTMTIPGSCAERPHSHTFSFLVAPRGTVGVSCYLGI